MMLFAGEASSTAPAMIAIDATGQGAPLVLLHGVGANRSIWRRVSPGLATDRLVLAPDLPGFGKSPAIPGPFALGAVAQALADALADRVGGSFDLVGNSLGGAVALILAQQRPELVARLVLAAPAGFSPRSRAMSRLAGEMGGPAVVARRVLGTPLAGFGTARRALLWGTVAAPQRLPAADARAMLQASRGSTCIGPAIAAVLRTDLRPQIAALETPVGLIWGERDRIVPISTLSSIRQLRPDAPFETIPEASHVPQIEQPEAFVGAVTRLLTRL